MRDTLRDSELSQTSSTSATQGEKPEQDETPDDEIREDRPVPLNEDPDIPNAHHHIDPNGITVEDAQIPSPPNVTDTGIPRLQRPHKWRKVILTIGVTLITLDLCVLPIVYYYALKFGTTMNLQDIFAVITGVYGLISFTHLFFRSIKLFFKSKARKFAPVGWKRWGLLEFLHINLLIVITLFEIELVVGTIPNNPIVRLCAMPSPTICFYFGFLFIYTSILTELRVTLPFNMSSVPKGSVWRPAIYAFIEDFGAIEMRGEKAFRAQLMRRYDASFMFRRMIKIMSWWWGVSFIIVAIVATVLIMTLPVDIGFGVGWGLPYAWSAVNAIFTSIYVKYSLRRETAAWQSDIEKGRGISATVA